MDIIRLHNEKTDIAMVEAAPTISFFKSDPDYFEDLPNGTVKEVAEGGNIYAQLELARRYCVRENSRSRLYDINLSEVWFKKVLDKRIKTAKRGDLAMQLKLGELYRWGEEGAEKDERKSTYWYGLAINGYRAAACRGDAEAQYALGICYELGEGVIKDLTMAIFWLEQAAEQGYPEAMSALRDLYDDKDYEVHNEDIVRDWQEKYDAAEFLRCKGAAECGDAAEQSWLGDYNARDRKSTRLNSSH